MAVAEANDLTIHTHCAAIEVHGKAFVLIWGAITISIDCSDRGAGAIFGAHAQCVAVAIVAAAEEILIFVGVEMLVHRDGEDVFIRSFIVHRKVLFVVSRERIACRCDLLTIGNASLKSIHLHTINREKMCARPHVHLIVEQDFAEQEIGYGLRETSIIAALQVAVGGRKIGYSGL